MPSSRKATFIKCDTHANLCSCFILRKSIFGARSHLDPWRLWKPGVPPGGGKQAAGAHHWWGEECGTHQPVHQEWGGSLPDQRWEEDPQRPGGGVQWPVQRGNGTDRRSRVSSLLHALMHLCNKAAAAWVVVPLMTDPSLIRADQSKTITPGAECWTFPLSCQDTT